ncbi:MAG: DUF2459 domain-containing protein [Alphaproteobacteria bacterium]
MAKFSKPSPAVVCLAVVLALLVNACAGPVPASPGKAGGKITIFVTSNGWHTGLVMAKTDIPPGLLPEVADFAEAVYVEFAWGDAKFYPAKVTTALMTMRAALLPTPAVMHVVGLWTAPERYFPEAEIVTLSVGRADFRNLVEFIHGGFERSGAQRVAASAPGLYPSSGFYPATGRFHLFNTCNTWTARALRAAGFKIKATGTTQAEALMQQVRGLGPL